MASPSPGDRIGRFVVTGSLGQGGVGRVLDARDPELGRPVALKLLRDKRGDTLRFLREAQALASLSHPNVVSVYELGAHDGAVYVAMERVDGMTLERWLARATRRWQEVLAVFVQAGRGLAAVHERGLVHRDFKPSNVIVDRRGRAFLGDFGLVRREAPAGLLGNATTMDLASPSPSDAAASAAVGPALAAPLTAPGAVLGTLLYMAPEQHAGACVTHHADQFAFCVALWEGVHGVHPFVSARQGLRLAFEGGAIQPPPSTRRVPRWLERALVRGLSPDPRDRWPSTAELVHELETRPRRSARRRLAVGAAAAVMATWVAVALVASGAL